MATLNFEEIDLGLRQREQAESIVKNNEDTLDSEEDEVEGEEADEYELISASGGNNSLVQKILTLDISDQPVYTQVAVGAASGWATGFVSSRVGKVLASALGGSLLLIHLGQRAGYITVDWKKLEGDINVAQEEMKKKMAASEDSPRARAFLKKGTRFITKNMVAVGGFLGGFFLGMAT